MLISVDHLYSQIFLMLFLQALATQDFAFLQSLLLAATTTSSSSLHAGALSATLQTSSSESALDAQVRWLEAFMLSLWEKNAFEASAHAGLIVAWHLNNGNAGMFSLLWTLYPLMK